MAENAVLTAIGADRPGLVEQVSEFVFKSGGNIADSRMVNLRGEFAMMLLVSGDADALRRMRATLPTLIQKSGLHIELRAATPTAATAQKSLPYHLFASSLDQAGLVHRVAAALRALDVNIESMSTTLSAAPMTGAPVFEMDLTMTVPGSLPLSQFRKRLGEICEELNIDWQLSPA